MRAPGSRRERPVRGLIGGHARQSDREGCGVTVPGRPDQWAQRAALTVSGREAVPTSSTDAASRPRTVPALPYARRVSETGPHSVPEPGQFTFVDLFAGIGGFHAALSALGGTCWMACEIDNLAKAVYHRNWGLSPEHDVTEIAPAQGDVTAPPHDILAAGFPCQPFSKSGKQHGFRDVTRGTLVLQHLPDPRRAPARR